MRADPVIQHLVPRSRPSWLETLARSQPALADWAETLRDAVASACPSVSALQLAGRGLVVEGTDDEELEYWLRDIADGLAVGLVRVEGFRLDDYLQQESEGMNPTIVQFDFGPWIASEGADSGNLETRRRLIAAMTDPADRRVFVTCARDFLDVAIELRCVGRFDTYMAWEDPTPDRCLQDFFKATEGVRISTQVTRDLDRLGRFLCVRFPARRLLGLLGLALRRLSHRAGRPIDMHDLMEFAANGTRLRSHHRQARDERKIAIHEAGHAVAHIVASGWRRIPDFVSIVATRGYLGVMIESFNDIHCNENEPTVEDVLIQIKTKLGGRAAEVSALGLEEVCAFGAHEDLVEARALAQRLVVQAGVRLEDGKPQQIPWAEPHKPETPLSTESSEAVESLLQQCWAEVLSMMATHRNLLMQLVEGLVAQKHLLESDVVAILQGADASQLLAA